jgi:hypothetical protein
MVSTSSSNAAGLANDEEALPKVSQVSRVVALTSFGALAIGFSWMAVSLLLPWIQTGTPPPTFTPTTVCMCAFGPLAFVAWMGTVLIHRFGTRLSQQGISFPTLRGRVLVPWSEIERVQIQGPELRLWSPAHRMAINIYCYMQPTRVPPFVHRHLPTHVLCQLGS